MRRLLPLLLVLPLAGCSGPPPLTPVEGTVTFAGNRPGGNLLLQFQPTAGTGRKPVSGSAVTDDTGKFQVKCDDGRDGLPAGSYVVTVVDNNLAIDAEPGRGKAPPPNRVPPRYMAADATNPLQVTVEAGKSGYDLKLE